MLKLKAITGSKPDDDVIIDRILNGDKESYELIIRKYNQRLYSIGRTYLNNEDDIEDVMQETYIKAYVNLKSFKKDAVFSTWLTRILINEALRKLKKEDRKMTISIDKFRDDGDDSPVFNELSNNITPESIMLKDELRQGLEKAVEMLPDNYKTIFIMRENEGMSLSEISESLGLNINTVKIRLLRARQHITKLLFSVYREKPIFEFQAVRCNRMVENVLKAITPF